MNSNMLAGFKDELEKSAGSFEEGVKGLGVGALVGAVLSAVGTEALEKLVTRNKDIAIITGAIMGAGALGGAGFLMGGIKDAVTNDTQPLTPPPGTIFHGAPPAGTPIGSMRHI